MINLRRLYLSIINKLHSGVSRGGRAHLLHPLDVLVRGVRVKMLEVHLRPRLPYYYQHLVYIFPTKRVLNEIIQ